MTTKQCPVAIEQMTDAGVAAEWIQSRLKERFPDTVFTISTRRRFLGKHITVKYISGLSPDAQRISRDIDECCAVATRWHDPEYGIHNKKTSQLSGRYIGPNK